MTSTPLPKNQTAAGPHQGGPVAAAGAQAEKARAAVLLVHGRGATAESILVLADELEGPGVAYLAPQAAGNTWYPSRFLAPVEDNEPGLSSGLARLDELVTTLTDRGVPPERTLLVGFSQGACLTLEYAARYPRRFGGVAGLTGGLIGPPGTPRDYPGSLDGTPVFLGSGDPDPHVPWKRVEETARVLEAMGAQVTARRYPGMPHTVNQDELQHLQALLDGVLAADES